MAGKAGLLLGLISTACMFLEQWISVSQTSPAMLSITGTLLWVLETGGCIYFMALFMRRFTIECPGVTRGAAFRMGMVTALLSGFVYSVAFYVNITVINAGLYAEQFKLLTDTMMTQMDPLMDQQTKTAMEKAMSYMPQMMFLSNLLYCFGFGTLASLFVSRRIPIEETLSDNTQDQQ